VIETEIREKTGGDEPVELANEDKKNSESSIPPDTMRNENIRSVHHPVTPTR